MIETGVSDFHKMVVTVLKSYFRKREAKIIKYRSNKNFCNGSFKQQLLEELNKKKKLGLRANEAPFVTRKLKESYNGKVKTKEYIFKASNK